MLILRIRQAETALADGRLDEAYELARADDVRAHRRGQGLVGRLVRSLVSRSRDHLAAGRLGEALADCEKAQRLGGSLPEIASLRAAISRAMSDEHRSRRRRAGIMTAAREHVENGRLSVGERLLGDVDGESGKATALRNEAAARRQTADAALRRAEAAIDEQDWDTAIDALAEAGRAHAANDRVAAMSARLTKLVNQQIRQAVEQGRLDRADLLIRRVQPLSGRTIETRELGRILEQCHLAREYVEQGHVPRAVEILEQLGAIVPDAGWIQDALDSARQTTEGLGRLRGGPLGLLGPAPPEVSDVSAATVPPPKAAAQTQAGVGQVNGAGRLPGRFMIHVDGVGSYLVLRERQVTIGPAGSSHGPELALMAESGLPPATIERVDDDYFLSSSGQVRVNDRPTKRKLLANGDKIALSRRCRVRFSLPHAASTSAVLDLSGTRLPQGDARRVILLDRNIVVGPGPSSHIRADQLAGPIVLSIRDGRLFCGGNEPVTVDDRAMDRMTGVPMDAQVRVGPVSFVVTSA